MNRMLRFAIIVFAAFAVAAPAYAAENWPDSFSAYVAKVRKTVKTTDAKGYLAAVKNPNGAMLIDVREPSEYATGHVVGTVKSRAVCSNSRYGRSWATRKRSKRSI